MRSLDSLITRITRWKVVLPHPFLASDRRPAIIIEV
jgi:hypothetical protein